MRIELLSILIFTMGMTERKLKTCFLTFNSEFEILEKDGIPVMMIPDSNKSHRPDRLKNTASFLINADYNKAPGLITYSTHGNFTSGSPYGQYPLIWQITLLTSVGSNITTNQICKSLHF